MKFYKKGGDGGKEGLAKAIMNGWVDTSAHYDFS